jgi:hypothetical protein
MSSSLCLPRLGSAADLPRGGLGCDGVVSCQRAGLCACCRGDACERARSGAGRDHLLTGRIQPEGGRPEARRMGLGRSHRIGRAGAGLCRSLAPDRDGLSQRRSYCGDDRVFGQAGTRDADGGVHDPPEGRQAPLQHLQQRADALSAAADLGRGGAPRRRPARLSREPRLRAPADGIRQEALRHHPYGRRSDRQRAGGRAASSRCRRRA